MNSGKNQRSQKIFSTSGDGALCLVSPVRSKFSTSQKHGHEFLQTFHCPAFFFKYKVSPLALTCYTPRLSLCDQTKLVRQNFPDYGLRNPDSLKCGLMSCKTRYVWDIIRASKTCAPDLKKKNLQNCPMAETLHSRRLTSELRPSW